MGDKDYGRTKSGKPITGDLIEELADRAEQDFDVEEIIRRRGGRPPIGASAATVESVRLDPDLREALRSRAEREGRTSSELIREALRQFLEAS